MQLFFKARGQLVGRFSAKAKRFYDLIIFHNFWLFLFQKTEKLKFFTSLDKKSSLAEIFGSSPHIPPSLIFHSVLARSSILAENSLEIKLISKKRGSLKISKKKLLQNSVRGYVLAEKKILASTSPVGK